MQAVHSNFESTLCYSASEIEIMVQMIIKNYLYRIEYPEQADFSGNAGKGFRFIISRLPLTSSNDS